MSEKPLFSVLIANYNNGKYIEEAIASVIAQTNTNWEIILVDDASTDSSHGLYKHYADDNRIKVFYNETNQGCGYTKRKCVELASGEICGFLDPDDKLATNALGIMVQLHQEQPDCSLIYSTLYEFTCRNEDLKIGGGGKIEDWEDYLINSQYGVCAFATFKKSFYNKTIGIDPSLVSAVDCDLYYKLEEVGKLYFINEPLYYFRADNTNSISIGSDYKVKSSYLNMMIASWNGIIRRITTKSELYLSKTDVYHKRMRVFLDYFIVNKDD